MNYLFLHKITVSILISLSLFSPIFAFAQETPFDKGLEATGKSTGFKTNETETDTSIARRLSTLIMPFLGVIYFLLVMYGGYLWMTASGNDQQITKARNIIIMATIGLLIVMSAYAISWYIFNIFSKGYIT